MGGSAKKNGGRGVRRNCASVIPGRVSGLAEMFGAVFARSSASARKRDHMPAPTAWTAAAKSSAGSRRSLAVRARAMPDVARCSASATRALA